LAEVWEPLQLPLLGHHPALTPTTILEHLQEQKPDQEMMKNDLSMDFN
jgi:hypothetical protein